MITISEWTRQMLAMTKSIEETGSPLLTNSPLVRAITYSFMPLCCGTCILWSTLWRCLASPCMCFIHGPTAVCSNNGCTSLSDHAISSCVNNIQLPIVLPEMPCISDTKLSSEDLLNLLKAIQKLEDHFTTDDAYKTMHYKLCEHVVCKMQSSSNWGGSFRHITPFIARGMMKNLRVDILQQQAGQHGTAAIAGDADTVLP